MSKYKKVTEQDVFECYAHQSSIIDGGPGVYSVPLIAEILGTSKYQVRKHVKMLVENGLLERASVIPPRECEFPLPYNGFSLTVKGENTEVYKNFEKEEIEWLKEFMETSK